MTKSLVPISSLSLSLMFACITSASAQLASPPTWAYNIFSNTSTVISGSSNGYTTATIAQTFDLGIGGLGSNDYVLNASIQWYATIQYTGVTPPTTVHLVGGYSDSVSASAIIYGRSPASLDSGSIQAYSHVHGITADTGVLAQSTVNQAPPAATAGPTPTPFSGDYPVSGWMPMGTNQWQATVNLDTVALSSYLNYVQPTYFKKSDGGSNQVINGFKLTSVTTP